MEERELKHIEKNGTCLLWTGSKDAKGYGYIGRNGKTHRAHRYLYEKYRQAIPNGYVLDHLCRNPSCVNPDHLEVVTQAINTHRGVGIPAINKAKTHCKNGHEFTPENTIMRKNGTRNCRTCINLLKKKYRASE